MSSSDFTLAFIFLCILQGCTSKDCESYDDSLIKDDCDELIIADGTVCYIATWWNRWDANITCQEGYDLIGSRTLICRYRRKRWTFVWLWSRDKSKTECVREQRSTPSQTSEQRSTTTQTSEQRSTTSQTPVSAKRGSLFVVYITVPTVAIVICVIVLGVLFYRRRKLAENARSKNQSGRTSVVTNKAYDDNTDARVKNTTPPGRVDNNDVGYADIPDSTYQNTGGSEYSTLHMDELGCNTPNYNHLPLRSDTYDHTTNTVWNVQKMTNTYFHLNNANRDTNSNGWNKKTGDVYNELGADDKCVKAVELDPTSTESDYDHTNACSEKSARIELDTYSRVNDKLGENDDDSQEYHNYFVLEKNE